MHNWIKIYHVVQELCAIQLTDHGQTDQRTDLHSEYSAHLGVVQYYLDFKNMLYMRASRKFCQRGPTLTSFFFFFFFFFYLCGGRKKPKPLKSGNHRPSSKTPFKWRFAGVPMMAQLWMLVCKLCNFKGSWTSIAKKTYIFVIFQGWVRNLCPHPTPKWIRTCSTGHYSWEFWQVYTWAFCIG